VDPDDEEAAAVAAERMLAAADRSGAEIRRRLGHQGFSPATTATTVARLEARGWLDDARLARGLAEQRLAHGYGRRRVIADLAARGIDPAIVNAAAGATGTEQVDAARAAALRLRRGHPAGPPDQGEVRRLYAALQRRGFNSGDIRTVLRELAEEPREEDLVDTGPFERSLQVIHLDETAPD
jgi:regulatory protein